MVTDPVSDLIIQIKNAGKVRKESVLLPYSKLKEAIANVLVAEGHLKSVAKKKNNLALEIFLNYHNGESKIKEVREVKEMNISIIKSYSHNNCKK
jgi:small subunit ribosomal protein S8